MSDQATLVAPSTPPSTAIHESVVAVYETHQAAEDAIRALAKTGLDLRTLSIVGRDYSTEEGVVGFYNAGDRVKAWGKAGAFWGGLWSMLFGSALFVVPGVGPLFAAGPLVLWIVGALEGATIVGGMSALGAALYGIGIPKDSIVSYEVQIKAGKFVVIAHGTADQVAMAKTQLLGAQHHAGKADGCA